MHVLHVLVRETKCVIENFEIELDSDYESD